MDELFKIALIGTGLILIVAGYYASNYYLHFKRKLSELRECFDAVDDALKDDTVSEEEFRKVWERCYAFFMKLSG